MKNLTLAISLMFSFCTLAQHKSERIDNSLLQHELTYNSKFQFDTQKQLISHLEELYAPNEHFSLKLNYEINGGSFYNQHFTWQYDNVPVYGSWLLARSVNNTLNQVRMTYLYTPEHLAIPSKSGVKNSSFAVDYEAEKTEESSYWLLLGDSLISVTKLNLQNEQGLNQEIIYNEETVYLNTDNNKYFKHNSGPDSVVTAMVFDPDPLTTAMVNYGGAYVDNNDATTPELDAERKARSLKLYFENGIFKAENDDFRIVEIGAPAVTPYTGDTNFISLTRDHPNFEDLNVLYHLGNQKRHLANIGFPDYPAYQLRVDAHSLNGADDSRFNTVSPYSIEFGTGGIDDAEDADVILHEFMHAAIWQASPNMSTPSVERSTLEEGICDYFASSYSNTVNLFNQQKVYNWDGNVSSFSGRQVRVTKNYQTTNFGGSIYTHTNLIADALMYLNDSVGRNVADELVFAACFGLGPATTFYDFGILIAKEDSIRYNKAHYKSINEAFLKNQIFTQPLKIEEPAVVNPEIIVTNTLGFSSGDILYIESTDSGLSSIEVFDGVGRLVDSYKPHVKKFNLDGAPFKQGFYLVKIKTQSGLEETLKVIRGQK